MRTAYAAVGLAAVIGGCRTTSSDQAGDGDGAAGCINCETPGPVGGAGPDKNGVGSPGSGSFGSGDPPVGGGQGGGGSLGQVGLDGCENAANLVEGYSLIARDSHATFSATYADAMLSHDESSAVGLAPAPSHVNANEVLNFHDVGFATSTAPTIVAYADLSPKVILGSNANGGPEVQKDSQVGLLQIIVRAPERPRAPLNLAVLVDTSMSMSGPALGRAQAILSEVSAHLTSEDRLSLLTWSGDNVLLLQNPGDPGGALLDVTPQLETATGSRLPEALAEARAALAENSSPERTSRTLIITDGATNLDKESAEGLERLVDVAAHHDVLVVSVGSMPLGPSVVAEIQNRTAGKLHHVRNEADADHLFGERFNELFDDAAFNVRLSLATSDVYQVDPVFTEALLDPGAGLVRAHNLANGGMMVFRQWLTACHPDVYASDSYALSGTVSYELLDGTTESIDVQKIEIGLMMQPLNAASPASLRTQGLLSYVEALRQPSATRIDGALTKLTVLDELLGDGWLTPFMGLLERHPAGL